MKTAVLARSPDPGLLSLRAWRRLEEAGALWVDPTVDRGVAARLPACPRLGSALEALAHPGPAVLVVNEALRDLRGHPDLEWIPDLPPALAATARAGWPVDPRMDGPVLLVQAEPRDWDAVASLEGPLLFGPDGPDLEGLDEAGWFRGQHSPPERAH